MQRCRDVGDQCNNAIWASRCEVLILQWYEMRDIEETRCYEKDSAMIEKRRAIGEGGGMRRGED